MIGLGAAALLNGADGFGNLAWLPYDRSATRQAAGTKEHTVMPDGVNRVDPIVGLVRAVWVVDGARWRTCGTPELS